MLTGLRAGTRGWTVRRRRWRLALLVPVVVLGLLATGRAQDWELAVCAEPDSLPFSNRQEEGFENRIAELIGEELGASVRYEWLSRPYAAARSVRLRDGSCDLIVGVTDGHPGFLTTLAYYRSTYMFVQRADRAIRIESLDDPALRDLQIGVQVGRRGVSPAAHALAKRDLVDNQVGLVPNYAGPDPMAVLVEAVAAEEVDVAIVWGPVAGYFAARQDVPLEIHRVTPEILMPFIPMVASIAMGLRPGDEALAERVNVAIARRWGEIDAVLREYRVPLLELPKPQP